MTKDVRESYLDDVQILRERGLSTAKIAEALSQGERVIHQKQVERWKYMLREQGRWRNIVVTEWVPRNQNVKQNTKTGHWERAS
jgi:hypothetical protein